MSVRAQLDAAREELARLAARNEDAEREVRALREAVEARDTFIAIAGFELRNPMGAIALGLGNLLFQANRADNVPRAFIDRLEALDKRTRYFVRRSTTLLDVSRLASGQLGIHRETSNLSVVVEQALSALQGEAARSGSTLALDLEPDVIGFWDGAALEQVVLQLLSNALRFGAGMPIDVSLRRDRSSGRDAAVFSVRDRGPGISGGDRARIFESFERAVATRECAGFGLGLWIARQLVVAHGGEIAVDVEPAAGSVFTVTLPRDVRDGSRPRP